MDAELSKIFPRTALLFHFLRLFLWPTFIIGTLLFYEDDVLEILKTREVELPGVKIGKQIQEIQRNATIELDGLAKQVSTLQGKLADQDTEAAALSEQISARIESLGKSIEKETSLITLQTANIDNMAGTLESRGATAQLWEEEGFDALAQKDVYVALTAFKKAMDAWPEYHNVEEIYRTLAVNRQGLADKESPVWGDVYSKILTEFSWGIPASARERMRAYVDGKVQSDTPSGSTNVPGSSVDNERSTSPPTQ